MPQPAASWLGATVTLHDIMVPCDEVEAVGVSDGAGPAMSSKCKFFHMLVISYYHTKFSLDNKSCILEFRPNVVTGPAFF